MYEITIKEYGYDVKCSGELHISDMAAVYDELVNSGIEGTNIYIEFRFYIGERLMRSTVEFFGLGDDADAMNIFSWRGDWINIEECGRIDNLAEIAGNLQTRLTGAINGRSYIGRLSMISNPIDNPDMWNLFDLALKRPEKVLSISVSTLHNKNVSDDQVESMRMVVPEGKQEAYILGARTEPEGGFFDRATVAACGSDAMSELIKSSNDSNSTQKYLAEMLTTDRISGEGLSIEAITPMDFSASKKMGYLASLRIAMEDKKLLWPSMVKGTRQITGYDPIRDTANSKFPQDVVSCFSMSAFGIRRYWAGLPDEDSDNSEKSESLDIDDSGVIRRERDSAPISRWYSGTRTKR